MTAPISSDDRLLEEYMRVINHKDSEILDLVAKVERLEVDLRKQNERYRSKILDLKSALKEVQGSLESTDRVRADESREVKELRDERDRLAEDLSTLRLTLQRHEDHLKGVLRSSTKAHKHESVSRERLEHEMRELKKSYEEKAQSALDRIAALEVQLSSALRKIKESGEEAHRMRQEYKKACDVVAERDQEITSIRNRVREFIPRHEAAAEIQQLEERHQIIVDKLDKDLKRFKSDMAIESSNSNRKETVVVQLKSEVTRLEHELAAAKRASQDSDLLLAQERLLSGQKAEEAKHEFEAIHQELRSQLSAALAEKHRLEGELAICRQRLGESEDHRATTRRGWTDAEAAFEQEIHDLKVFAGDRKREAETNARLVSQLQEALRNAAEQSDARLDKAQKECLRLRSDLEAMSIATNRQADLNAQRETAMTEMRRESQRFTTVEQDLKRRLADAEASLQSALSEYRMHHSAHADEIRDVRSSEQRLRMDAQREAAQFNQRAVLAEAEVARLQSSLEVLVDKERQVLKSQKESDAEFSRMQVQLADKDATISAVRRSSEAATASIATLQSQLEQARRGFAEASTDNERLQVEGAKLRCQLQIKEAELQEAVAVSRKNEEAARDHSSSVETEIATLNQRIRSLSSQLNDAEHRCTIEVTERNRHAALHQDELQRLHRETIAPLHDKVDALTIVSQRAEVALRDREEKLKRLESAAAERDDLRRQFDALGMETNRLKTAVVTLQETERDAMKERDTNRKQRGEIEHLLSKLASTETALESASRELSELHSREVSLVTQISNKNAELSALGERFANADSLRKISEKQVHELQGREQELLQRLDETRMSHGVLQACFEKQQEQLEAGRRLRDLDLATRERNRPGGATPH